MYYINKLVEFATANLPQVFLILAGIILIALITFIVLIIRVNKLSRQYRRFMRGTDQKNLELILNHHMENVEQALQKTSEINQLYANLNKQVNNCLQHIGVVRFNAFDDIGGDLSFSVAILDKDKNGIVLSNIYGRHESRVYAKPLKNGKSTYQLSDEEEEAVLRAFKTKES